MKGFWSFDWLTGNVKKSFMGQDEYGAEDGQFMIFGQYPYSRSRTREISSYEISKKRVISEEEKKARLEGLARVAQSNYECETYSYKKNKNKIHPYK